MQYLKSQYHTIGGFLILCTIFHNTHFLQKCLIFSWFSIFHNRGAAERVGSYELRFEPRSNTESVVEDSKFLESDLIYINLIS
jgi:hypothetical protein